MRKYIITFISVAALMILTSSSILAQPAAHDGSKWVSMKTPEKMIYLDGFIGGMFLGNSFSYWDFMNSPADKPCLDKTLDAYDKYVDKYLSKVTTAQLERRLTEFYADPRNRKIKIGYAVWLALYGIAGAPKEELNRMIESYRKYAAK